MKRFLLLVGAIAALSGAGLVALAQPAPQNCTPGRACKVFSLTVARDAGVGGNLSVGGALTSAGQTLNGNLTVNGDAGVVGGGYYGSTITSNVASGSNAIALTTNGARIDLGTGTKDYLTSDGFAITLGGTVNISGGGLNVLSNNIDITGAGYITNSSAGSALKLSDADGVLIAPLALPTCDAAHEGALMSIAATGGTRTKLCLCTSDGGGTPAYAWQNLASAALGNTTTCG